MPIEIREIIVRTEIASLGGSKPAIKEKEVVRLKKQLLDECRRMITENTKKNLYKR